MYMYLQSDTSNWIIQYLFVKHVFQLFHDGPNLQRNHLVCLFVLHIFRQNLWHNLEKEKIVVYAPWEIFQRILLHFTKNWWQAIHTLDPAQCAIYLQTLKHFTSFDDIKCKNQLTLMINISKYLAVTHACSVFPGGPIQQQPERQ